MRSVCDLATVSPLQSVSSKGSRTLAMHFMSPECYQGQCQGTIDMLEYEENYIPLNEVFVGFNTKHVLTKSVQ